MRAGFESLSPLQFSKISHISVIYLGVIFDPETRGLIQTYIPRNKGLRDE
jgi:hypothetical protein